MNATRIPAAALVMLLCPLLASCDPPTVTSRVALMVDDAGQRIVLGDTCGHTLTRIAFGSGTDRRAPTQWQMNSLAEISGAFEIDVVSPGASFSVEGEPSDLDEEDVPFFIELWVNGDLAGSQTFREVPEPGHVLWMSTEIPYEEFLANVDMCSDRTYSPTVE